MWLFYENGRIQQIFVSTVDTMLWHQSISGHSAEYAPMYFQLFMG